MPSSPLLDNFFFPLPDGTVWKKGGGVSSHGSRPLGNWESDNAIDIMAPAGTPVLAIASGKVISITGHDPSEGVIDGSIFGRSIHYLTDAGVEVFDTHLQNPNVKVGQRITAGQQLSRIADWGGNSHLHTAFKAPYNPEVLWGATDTDGILSDGTGGDSGSLSAAGLGCGSIIVAAVACTGAVTIITTTLGIFPW